MKEEKPLPFASYESFPTLNALPFIRAAFLQRAPNVCVDTNRALALERLRTVHEITKNAIGFDGMPLATAEQVHGKEVKWVFSNDAFPIPGCDGLLTTQQGLCLGIYVADCAAVYLVSRNGRGIALVHSGKKGTELGIVPRAVEALCNASASQPSDIILQVSPCIRPPHYEIDFPAQIIRQASAAGVRDIHDCGTCTASHPLTYYSYRREKGQTGRMLALLALLPIS